MGTRTAYDAVIFDNDGVLTTPTDRTVLETAMREAFKAIGVSDPSTEHVDTLLGPDVPSLRRVAAEHGVDPDELWTAREEAAIAAQLAELRAGRKRPYDDVATLDSLSVSTAIVSNNQHETIGNILEHCEFDGFDVWYGREPTLEGIERKKPTPYYLEQALADLGVENPLFVGDSRVDVAAADAAGIDAAFIRRSHRSEYELSIDPAHEIDSLEALPDLI
ncbi:HAD family hydrolase [Natrinema salifodinae]|uniref:Haloacid dehalogenase superfamily, subfamily IA, variant 1 with third motif having Dx(3-4)D or Dx(3-4)E n=1 Tax=Natrinema salifodinae TaxID=1202768 RepID=A0A1I0M6F9_9EURY|nr:HAD-IA family hydrolase [Natrinema salifodinae]SEV82951.1 haloacid dehalogenase superfamily, subfamily IA, variant 1 with third motif having Dx(3-4)D or Dx(3-4)E [Natrinema salifodinae]